MTVMTAWRHIGLDDAFAILDDWDGRRVIVSVDLAEGAPGLAGMTGVLRSARRDDDALTLEVEGAEAWLRLPAGPCFRGASYDAATGVLVLEFCGDDAAAVLVDVQLLTRRASRGARVPA